MKYLAVIPARGGSKRIKNKNIKLLKGKPIISYPIQLLTKSELFDEVIVSTDDSKIAEEAKKYGAKVPFFRSVENSDDFATLSDVLLEVLNSYERQNIKFDYLCCVLPTSALLKIKKIEKALRVLKNNNFDSVIPVVKYSTPIQRALKSVNGVLEFKNEEHLNTRTQDLEHHYFDSGQFYWINTRHFHDQKRIFMSNTGFIELKEFECQDVDTLEDWELLELKHELILQNNLD